MERVSGVLTMTMIEMFYNSSSSHADDIKNNFLILGERDTFGINGSFGAPEKKFSINFSDANTKFCLSLHYNGDNSYLFVNGKEIFKFKADYKNVNFATQFFLGMEMCMIFQSIAISLIKLILSNIRKYLMTKNNIK